MTWKTSSLLSDGYTVTPDGRVEVDFGQVVARQRERDSSKIAEFFRAAERAAGRRESEETAPASRGRGSDADER